MHVYTKIYTFQVRRCRAYLDSLSMDGAEFAVNCLCSAHSCPTCWCPDSDMAKADKRAQPGTGWTPASAELNSILQDHVIAGELTTFGYV